MRVYISSAVDALILLRGLEKKAGDMTDYSISLNGSSARTSIKIPSLRLAKTIDGRPTYTTISRHNKRTLVASLENEEELGKATAKRRLAALLIPLVTEYVRTNDSDFMMDDRVRIVFDEALGKGQGGKRCVLFAGAATDQVSSCATKKPNPHPHS